MFLLDDRMIGIRTSHQRIRIQKAKKHTDPDPQHRTVPPFARTHWPLLLHFCGRDPLLRQFWANFWQELSQAVSRQLLLGAAVA